MRMQAAVENFLNDMPENVLWIASGRDELRTGMMDADTGAQVVRLADLPTDLSNRVIRKLCEQGKIKGLTM